MIFCRNLKSANIISFVYIVRISHWINKNRLFLRQCYNYIICNFRAKSINLHIIYFICKDGCVFFICVMYCYWLTTFLISKRDAFLIGSIWFAAYALAVWKYWVTGAHFSHSVETFPTIKESILLWIIFHLDKRAIIVSKLTVYRCDNNWK